MTMQRTTKLPRLHKVTLNSFSLFRLQPTVAVDIDGDVFCLAGANGLGKSTFIAALNYGLTGGVAPPSIRVDQLPGYQRDAVAYGTRYFTGRIGELDRSGSSIELEFSVGEMHYRVRRRFFAPHELELFSVTTESGEVVVANEPSLDAEERHNRYTEQLLGDTGLQTFAQYVFLQHFVFTFDENRHLLFWDTRATELVLYLALGLDPSLAKRVDELRKAASASGSQARNSQYQATLARNELNSLTAQLKQKVPVDPDIVEQHRYLQAERERLTRERDSGRTDLRDAQLEFAEASAGLMRLRQQYDDAFARRIGISHSDPQLHPMLGQILADYLCRICGTQHDRAPEAIESAMHDRRCPLCQADLSAREVSEPNPDALVQIDRELAEAARRSGALTKTIERLDRELRRTQQNWRP